MPSDLPLLAKPRCQEGPKSLQVRKPIAFNRAVLRIFAECLAIRSRAEPLACAASSQPLAANHARAQNNNPLDLKASRSMPTLPASFVCFGLGWEASSLGQYTPGAQCRLAIPCHATPRLSRAHCPPDRLTASLGFGQLRPASACFGRVRRPGCPRSAPPLSSPLCSLPSFVSFAFLASGPDRSEPVPAVPAPA